jgi:sugar/nucleoside kinase (ribokinase family)
VLAAIGDLVEDIVVALGGPVELASDTVAVVERRRGGSAANVVAVAARLTGSARLLAQVGDDHTGTALLDELAAGGVDVSTVRRDGRTGSIIVLVDGSGERSFLTDPGVSRQLLGPDRAWLDGVDLLHVPLYSMDGGPIAGTTATLVGWAHERSIAVSIDASSQSLIERMGSVAVMRLLDELRPDALFANADEAAALNITGAMGEAITFVKHGRDPATVYVPGADPVVVAGIELAGSVDTTGAGDAFAAGVLTHPNWSSDPVDACRAGHRAAAHLLQRRI